MLIAELAQLVERFPRKEEVASSILAFSIFFYVYLLQTLI